MSQCPKIVALGSTAIYEGLWQTGLSTVVGITPYGGGVPVKDARRFRSWNKTANLQWQEVDWLSRTYTGKGITWQDTTTGAVVDPLTGLVYFLQDTDLLDGSPNMGGALMRFNPQEWGTIVEGVVTPSALTIALADINNNPVFLTAARDIKIDVARRLLWIADTWNHRVLGITIDTYQVVQNYSLVDFVCPCALAVDDSTGDVFVRAYTNDDLTETVLKFSQGVIMGQYSGLADFGWADLTQVNCAGQALVLEGGATQGVYRLNGGVTSLAYNTAGQTPLSISIEGLTGTVAIEESGGSITALSPAGTLLASFPISVNPAAPNPAIFPSTFDGSHWIWQYDVNYSAERPWKERFPNVASPITTMSQVVPGCAITGLAPAYDMAVYLLTGNGSTLTKMDRQGTSVLQQVTLPATCNLLAGRSDGQIIYVAILGQPNLWLYDRNLNLLASFTLSQNILGMADNPAAGSEFSSALWVIQGDQSLGLYGLAAPGTIPGTISLLTSVALTSAGLLGVIHDNASGGAWVWDAVQVYQMTAMLGIGFHYAGFANITGLAAFNYAADLYAGIARHFPNFSSITYDPQRSQLWWIADNHCKTVNMANTLTNSGRSLQLYCEQSSSSSSSSFSSSSSSSVWRSMSSSSSSSSSKSSQSSASSNSSGSSNSSSSSTSSSSSSSVSSSSSLFGDSYIEAEHEALYGYWSLGEDVASSSSLSFGNSWIDLIHGHDFTSLTGTIGQTTGVNRGHAIQLSSATAATAVFSDAALSGITSMAISCWFKQSVTGNLSVAMYSDTISDGVLPIISIEVDASGNAFIGAQPGNFSGDVGFTSPSFVADAWINIVGILDSTGLLSLYRQGIFVYSLTIGGGSYTAVAGNGTNVYFSIGSTLHLVSGSYPATGDIEGLAYWNNITFASSGDKAAFAEFLYADGNGRFYNGSTWREM